jgi:hypothetical protein
MTVAGWDFSEHAGAAQRSRHDTRVIMRASREPIDTERNENGSWKRVITMRAWRLMIVLFLA